MRINHIDPSIRLLAAPLIIIVASIFLVVSLFNTTYPKIRSELDKYNNDRKTISLLDQHLSILKEFKAGVLDDRSDITYMVLPDKNPGAFAFSQLKLLAVENKLRVKDIKFAASSGVDESVNKANISYNFEADNINTTLKFLTDLQNVAPLMTPDGVDISIKNGSVDVKLNTVVYWKSLPKSLPSLTEPIKDLTTEEENLIAKIYRFRLPQFSTLAPEPLRPDRLNPFN